MSWETAIAILAAVGGPSTVVALYRWARAQGRADALAEQARETVKAKDEEIAELATENTRLWSLFDQFTRPPEARS